MSSTLLSVRTAVDPRIEIHPLMPGCVLVVAGDETIQFGAPFDAFKQVFAFVQERGLPVPRTLVCPDASHLHDMALWAPEFYVLHHMFVYGAAFRPDRRHERVRLLMPAARIDLARRSLRETLLGPTDEQMRGWRRNGRRVMHEREIRHLVDISDAMAVRNPDGGVRDIDEIAEFVPHDAGTAVPIAPGIAAHRAGGDVFTLHAGAASLGVGLNVQRATAPLMPMDPPSAPVRRDTLGWVSLGNRSGFSLIGPNTGFLFWINGQGVLYDGPYGTLQYLRTLGVNPEEIAVHVVSHVHEDHIGSLLEVALMKHRPLLVTAEPVYRSVLTKLAVFLDTTPERAAEFVNYRRVRPHRATRLLGADVRFFYTVHPVPTLGMKIEVGGRERPAGRVVITGDNHNFAGLDALHAAGAVSDAMHREMKHLVPRDLDRNGHYLCDAGRAGIHGFDTDWNDNPNRIFFYHVDALDASVPPHHTLVGFGRPHTLVPPPEHPAEAHQALQTVLAALGVCDRRWPAVLLHQSRLRRWPRGAQVVQAGDAVHTDRDNVYIVVTGTARVSLPAPAVAENGAAGDGWSVELGSGDFFGEMAFLQARPRTASVEALSVLELLEIPARVFLDFVHELDLAPVFDRLWRTRDAMAGSRLFRLLSPTHRHRLAGAAAEHAYGDGDELFADAAPGDDFFVVEAGAVEILPGTGEPITIDAGLPDPYFGAFTRVSDRLLAGARARAVGDTRVMRVPGERLRALCDEVPMFRTALEVRAAAP